MRAKSSKQRCPALCIILLDIRVLAYFFRSMDKVPGGFLLSVTYLFAISVIGTPAKIYNFGTMLTSLV